jgi:hypothetical protein
VSRKQLVDDATHLFQTLADAAAEVASSRARARRRR